MKLSLIIICDHLREEKLQRLLQSIKGQVSRSTEILLLHESNTLQPPPSLPLTVRYILIPEKQGIPFNRNPGIAQAKGEIIIFIDDDCWVPENWLGNLIEPFNHDKALLAVTGGTRIPPSTFLGDCISALGFPG